MGQGATPRYGREAWREAAIFRNGFVMAPVRGSCGRISCPEAGLRSVLSPEALPYKCLLYADRTRESPESARIVHLLQCADTPGTDTLMVTRTLCIHAR
jgi:hypothetical protein